MNQNQKDAFQALAWIAGIVSCIVTIIVNWSIIENSLKGMVSSSKPVAGGNSGQTQPVPTYGTDETESIPTFSNTGGQIRIMSGDGSFSSISDAKNSLNVLPNTSLTGTIRLRVNNIGPPDAIAPLIWTPSWGDHSLSWKQVNNCVPSGNSVQLAEVSLIAPTVPGKYHIIFALCWEIGGSHVASATAWTLRRDFWNDGNDIADFNEAQLLSAQLHGWVLNSELNGPDSSHQTYWYQKRYYPADAINIIVTY